MDKHQLKSAISLSKEGDKQAFALLVHEFTDYLFALAFRIVNNEDEAKDVVQETFIRVWQNISKYNEDIKLTTWMYKICTNLCLDKLKHQKRKPLAKEYEFEKIEELCDDDISETLNNQQIAATIHQLAEGLTPKQKMVFVLKDIETLETEEIEEITGMNKGQIKSNLYYARQFIKQKLIETGYEVQ